MFEFLDGGTSGPRTLKGAIGRQIQDDLTKLPVVQFRKIRGLVEKPSQDVIAKLSKDQRYMLQISLACQQGPEYFDDNPGLASCSPGPLHQSRWLTKANRILRLYVASENPTYVLKRLVVILLNTYCHCWFFMKKKKTFLDGTISYFEIVKSYERTLTRDEQYVVQPILNGNNYFGNPENVLIAMLFDRSKALRRRSASMILQARARNSENVGIRKFKNYPVNMKAETCVDLVKWKEKDLQIFEPPWTLRIPDQDIISQIDNPNHIVLPHAPFHTQSVERHVQLIADVSSRVSGYARRHIEVLNTLHSRKIMPKFDNKRMFPFQNAEP